MAKELAAQGARVFFSGRTKTHVQQLAEAISSHGETAAAAEVDALDEDAVNSYLDEVVAAAGRIDIMFNAMGPQAVEYRKGPASSFLTATPSQGLLDTSAIGAAYGAIESMTRSLATDLSPLELEWCASAPC